MNEPISTTIVESADLLHRNVKHACHFIPTARVVQSSTGSLSIACLRREVIVS
jgi:hypothetical protein